MEGNIDDSASSPTTGRKCCSRIKITVEPVAFLYFAAMLVQVFIEQDLWSNMISVVLNFVTVIVWSLFLGNL